MDLNSSDYKKIIKYYNIQKDRKSSDKEVAENIRVWSQEVEFAVVLPEYQGQSSLSKAEEQRLAKIYNHGSDPERWIFGLNSGFEDVCRYVGVNPDHARSSLRHC